MYRLIDKNELLTIIEADMDISITGKRNMETVRKMMQDILDDIKESPVVDAVPVIRCKDCKYLRFTGTVWKCQNRIVMMLCEPSDYCSRAERKEHDKV